MSISDRAPDGMATAPLPPITKPIPVVGYHFECGDVQWHVRRVSIEETIGRPYHYTLDLVTDDTDLLIEEFVGANATLEISRDDETRLFKGYVDEIEHLGVVSHRTRIRVRVVPVLAWLARARSSRIFQGQTIPEIIQAVVTSVLSGRDRTVDVSALDVRGFQPRDYCVQFHENDLDFLHRLLEEEGLTYYFDQARETWETVVFTTTNDDFPAFEGLDGSREVPLARAGEATSTESIAAFDWTRRARAPRVHQRDWDFVPNPPQIYEASHENTKQDETAINPLPAVEAYESGDHRLLDPEVEARAERKQQALAVRDASGVGRSNVTGFRPGFIFELAHDEHAGRYLITHVTHEGDAPQADAIDGSVSSDPSYGNRFSCIPATTPYRPPRSTLRPTIPGPQTAVVTGPEGEEIHTDEHGRIKVRMHWDRSETPPEDASCWIRVAQMWSGPGWGSVFLPRVGMEVIVTFINGDPDRPLVTGCVYNGGNRPPYPLPNEKTKSTIKTSSSPGGDGYNELTFEDAAGAEKIILHAQKDLSESIGSSHSTSVGGSQSNSVGGDQSNTVGKDQTEKITGNVEIAVGKARTTTVTGLETVTLENARETRIGETELHQVTKTLTEQFDGGRETTVTGGDEETVATGDKTVTVSKGSLTASAPTRIALQQTEAHKLLLENKAELTTSGDFKVTNGKVTVESKGGTLALTGKDQVSIVCGTASITLSKDGTIEINGAKKTTLITQQSTVCTEPAGVTVNGPRITADATGIQELRGSLIKLN